MELGMELPPLGTARCLELRIPCGRSRGLEEPRQSRPGAEERETGQLERLTAAQGRGIERGMEKVGRGWDDNTKIFF